MFDGSLFRNKYYYTIRYTNASKSLVEEFVNDMGLVYGLSDPYREIYDKGKCYRVTSRAKKAYEDLLSYTPYFYPSDSSSKIPEELVAAEKKIQLEILRAFWRDEGSIAFSGKLTAELRSKEIIYQLKSIHENFDLYPQISKYIDKDTRSYKLYLLKKDEIWEKFHKLDIFGPSLVARGSGMGRKKSDILKDLLKE
ncbi:hypothetical protein AKJ51_02080 [candidate division MSBL1 archaeon SCGC-AAA382A20]|uniref:Homing endonuclease LAGLIDADG domain-containing protein n=2 Tax=candidate division MSBL1 TaxID=215777 RepID=A0A133VKV9_9EURY|nr:hypothetical protein AKJ50_01690 [candidate division MSBL1 archaeon SCGC-AAA382A13]KXB07086.1 hypothetical protein AKJ51_02080 [candidate division MSBL1 archaeon SCGC-AAA382A20]